MAFLLLLAALLLPVSAASAAEPVDNVLPFRLVDAGGAVVAELRVYEVSRDPRLPTDRPLVVIEGLDLEEGPYGGFGREAFESALREAVQPGGVDLWTVLLDSGADLYLVDFASFDVPVEDLADLLQRTLDALWTGRTQGVEPLVVVGVSLGGVVGRLAVYLGEQTAAPPPTALFASVDSPHRGALIPLGIQGVLQFWSKYSAEAADLLGRFAWASVRQVLLRRQVDRDPGTVLDPPPEFTGFQGAYRDALPLGPRTVAFSNGSASGAPQIDDPFLRTMFRFDFDPFGPGDFFVHLRSFPEAAAPTDYTRNEFGFLFFEEKETYHTTAFNAEAAPGGYRASYAQLGQSLKDSLRAMGYSGVPDPTLVDRGQHCFIPLASALDLDVDPTTRPGVWAVPEPGLPSSFDAVYVADAHTEHVDLRAYSIPLEAEVLGEVDVAPQGPFFYTDGASAPRFRVRPPRGTPSLYAVEVAADPALFAPGAPREEATFFSSYWGGPSPEAAGTVAPPLQDRAGTDPFPYALPPAVLDRLPVPARWYVRLVVFAEEGSANRYATARAGGQGASVLEVRLPGDLDGDRDADGADLGRFLTRWVAAAPEADTDNDGAVGPEDLGAFAAAFGAVR
ncbi:MAG: hypothetical protein Kow0092_31000 [Deferrisomatales bacterium]